MAPDARPTDAELRATYKRALLYGLELTRRKARATELVQEAMFAALEGPTAWDPEKHPDFASHVCNLMWSHNGNASQSYEATHSDGAITGVHENRGEDALPDAEESLLDDKQDLLAGGAPTWRRGLRRRSQSGRSRRRAMQPRAAPSRT